MALTGAMLKSFFLASFASQGFLNKDTLPFGYMKVDYSDKSNYEFDKLIFCQKRSLRDILAKIRNIKVRLQVKGLT